MNKQRRPEREAVAPSDGSTKFTPTTESSLTGSGSAVCYVRYVRKRFADQPEVFATFSRLLSDISQQGVDKFDIVSDVAYLFANHRDLLNVFLRCFVPEVSSADSNGQVVVLHMNNQKSVRVRFNQREDEFESELFAANDVTTNRKSDACGYIRRIQTVCDSDTYRQFMLIVQNYCAHQTSDVDTIHRIVILFGKHPELVVGFQRFLPEGCTLIQRDKFLYVLKYPDHDKHRSLYFMTDDNFEH